MAMIAMMPMTILITQTKGKDHHDNTENNNNKNNISDNDNFFKISKALNSNCSEDHGDNKGTVIMMRLPSSNDNDSDNDIGKHNGSNNPSTHTPAVQSP